jgi:hypothetical protein
MTTQNEEIKPEQTPESGGSRWGQMLTGFIFVLTCLLILGFLWQSVASFLFPE